MVKKIILTVFIFVLIDVKCLAEHLYSEKYYQAQWCGKWHGKMEYKLKDNTRVDCITTNYAVEFDFASKWAESIGQSLYYSKMTNKKPAVILIIEKPSDWKYYHRLNVIAKEHNVTLWYIKSPDYDVKSQSHPKTENDNFKIVYDYLKRALKNWQ